MRIKSIAGLLGSMLLVLAATMVFSVAWSVYYSDGDLASLVISMVVTFAAGIALLLFGRNPSDITIKESFLFVSLGWLLAAAFGALPFFLSGVLPAYLDAFFEAMSGFTTTGATVITRIEAVPRGILFWRSMTHWLGGMGIIVLFVAILPRFGFGATHLLKAEVPGLYPEKITPRIAATAKILWSVYMVLSAAQVVLLLLAGLSLFDALTHTFGTIATGGFSTRDASVGGLLNFKAELVIILFMIIAGGNFSLYYGVFKGNLKGLFSNPEFKFYLAFTGIMAALISINLYSSLGGGTALRQGVFQTVSIITTTGFTTADFDAWHPFSRALLFFLMFAGGSGGSTAGSIKQIRLLLLFKYIYREIYRTVNPAAVLPIKIGKKVVPEQLVSNALSFIFLYLVIFLSSAVIMSGLGLPLASAFSAVAATLGNVGPGLELVGPTMTYSPLSGPGKALLSLLMMLGRLEIYTVVVLFLPGYGFQLSLNRWKAAALEHLGLKRQG
jgi:trk system potassium uptake protein